MNWKDLGTRLLGALGAGLTAGIGAYAASPAIGWKGAVASGAATAVPLAVYGSTHTTATAATAATSTTGPS